MNEKQLILIVDDNPKNIKILSELLGNHENILLSFALSGEKAIKSIEFEKPDLILMDVIMPGMNGYQTCKKIKQNPKSKDIPVVFLTGKTESVDVLEGFNAGGIDYIKKPFNSLELNSRVLIQLELRGLQLNLREKVKLQTEHIRSLAKEIEETQRDIIYTLGSVTETRSHEVGNHVKRVADISYLLAIKYGLSEEDAKLLKMASPMHDIGKIGIHDNILNKPSKLSKEEFEIIKIHTTIGHSILKKSKRWLLKTAAIVALQHHEWWNGKGYPNQLSGDDIHIFGRITAIADVFDALTHKRLYKHAWSVDSALKEIKSLRGRQFQPEIVDIFFDNIGLILKINIDNIDRVSDILLNSDIDAKRHEVYSLLSHECMIFDGNPVHCHGNELRKLSKHELNEYVNKLTEAECNDIMNEHMVCICNHDFHGKLSK